MSIFFANKYSKLSQLLIWAISTNLTSLQGVGIRTQRASGKFPLFAVSGTIPLMRVKIVMVISSFLASCGGGNTSRIRGYRIIA